MERGNSTLWIAFGVGCAALMIVSVAAIVTFGIPGFTGGTSPAQQQTSGAPQPENEIREGGTRQNTTGYGDKSNQ
jgi:hypothetical protein